MWTLRLRDPRTLAVAGLLLAALALALAYDVRRAVEYAEEPVLRLAWGEGDMEVGLWPARDGRKYGPLSFALGPDGRLGVLDTVRQRLLLFDPAGRLRQVWPVRLPARAGAPGAAGPDHPLLPEGIPASGGPALWLTDLALTPGGGAVLVDAAGLRLIELAPDGSVRRSAPLPAPTGPDGRPLVVVDRVAVDRLGTVYVSQTVVSEGAYERRLLRLEPDVGAAGLLGFALRPGGAVEGPEPAVPVHSFAVDADGGVVVEAPRAGDPFRRLVRRYDRTGRLLAEWVVESPQLLRSAEVLGRDRLGGLALLLNPGRPDGRLVRLDGTGEPGFARPFPWHAEYPMTVYGRMDTRGNLYVAAADAQGWHLLRLRLRTPWRVVPARAPHGGAPGTP